MNAPRYCSEQYEEAFAASVWADDRDENLLAHLESCAACREAYSAEKALYAKTSSAIEAVPLKASFGLNEAVFERTTRKKRAYTGWMLPTGAMAGAMVTAAIFLYASGGGQKQAQTAAVENAAQPDPITFAEVDMEVLENMELIENMDLLEVLDGLDKLGDG